MCICVCMRAPSPAYLLPLAAMFAHSDNAKPPSSPFSMLN